MHERTANLLQWWLGRFTDFTFWHGASDGGMGYCTGQG
jgi:hypothetical protein